MNRREFIAGLGSAAAWPVVARAQQTKLPVIGVLGPTSATTSADLTAFLQGLKEAGFVEGKNVVIEYRWADGQNDRLPALAADLVNHRVAVICAMGGRLAAIAAKTASATIPIVFVFGGDPVREGLVASLSHPGGNVTGSMNFTGGFTEAKAVQLLREVVPAAASLGLLLNPTNRPPFGVQAETAARELRWNSQVFEASADSGLEMAFETMAKQKVGAVNVIPDPYFTSRRAQIVTLAGRYAIPASYYSRDFVTAGGLMSYGSDFKEPSRVAGGYVGRILKGERPSELPVQQPVKVELVINLKTATALGLTIPETLLATADEVIQ
jgi:putative tryptophan/tyrosine transport system substrate-binding protein